MKTPVYFYATCLGNAIFTKTSLKAIKLLQEAGCEVIFKKAQTCCGQPSYNTGYFDETKKIALYNMDSFSKPYPIIVPSGSCAGMMAHDYLEMFERSEHEQKAREFCSRVFELSEYLQKELHVHYEDKGEPIKVTWHSNCHALRVKKCIPYAKQILNDLKNVELIELEHEEECCGFGGTFSVKESEISFAMAKKKIEDIQSKNIELLLAADGGCLMNIAGTMEKLGVKIPNMHFYDFLYERVMGEKS